MISLSAGTIRRAATCISQISSTVSYLQNTSFQVLVGVQKHFYSKALMRLFCHGSLQFSG